MSALPVDAATLIEILDPAAAAKAARIAKFDAEEVLLGKEVARKAKLARDDDYFRRTPKWLIPTGAEQAAKRKEAEAFEIDLANAMYLGIPFNQLRNPVSNRGKEAKKAADLAKRRIADKARRDRKREQA